MKKMLPKTIYKLGILVICMQLLICLGGDVSFAAPQDHAAAGMAGGAVGSGAGISLEESQAQTRAQDPGYSVGEQNSFLVQHDDALKRDNETWEATSGQQDVEAESKTDYDLEIQRNQKALADRRAEEIERRRQRREQQERELAEIRASFEQFDNDIRGRNEPSENRDAEVAVVPAPQIVFSEDGPTIEGPLLTEAEFIDLPIIIEEVSEQEASEETMDEGQSPLEETPGQQLEPNLPDGTPIMDVIILGDSGIGGAGRPGEEYPEERLRPGLSGPGYVEDLEPVVGYIYYDTEENRQELEKIEDLIIVGDKGIGSGG